MSINGNFDPLGEFVIKIEQRVAVETAHQISKALDGKAKIELRLGGLSIPIRSIGSGETMELPIWQKIRLRKVTRVLASPAD